MSAVGYTGGDPNKVDVAGDTMTGPLVLPGDPVSDLQATTKSYVDAHAGGGGSTPSGTVVAETSYGQASSAGVSGLYSRGDHTHGTPALGTTGATAAAGNHNHTGTYDPAGSSASALASALAADVPLGSATPTAVSITAAGAAGSSGSSSHQDHTHAGPGFGAVVAETSFGQASSNGVASTVARSDHTHGTPAAPTVPSASGTVASETSFGISSSAGAASTYSRGDHTHGTPVQPAETVIFAFTGTAVVTTGVLRWYNRTGRTLTVIGAWTAFNTAPTGADGVVDVNKNGTTIFTTQANRPKATAGSNGGVLATPDVTSVADGDYLTVDLDQIGSSVAGANVTVGVVYR